MFYHTRLKCPCELFSLSCLTLISHYCGFHSVVFPNSSCKTRPTVLPLLLASEIALATQEGVTLLGYQCQRKKVSIKHDAQNTYLLSCHTHIHPDLPPLFLWEALQVQHLTLTRGCKGQKVCFSMFTPLLFIDETNRKEWRESESRETARNPQACGLWCWKQYLLFNLPSNQIHVKLLRWYAPSASPRCPLLFICLCLH